MPKTPARRRFKNGFSSPKIDNAIERLRVAFANDKSSGRAHAIVDSYFLERSPKNVQLVDLGIPQKTVGYLESAGIRTPVELTRKTRRELLTIPQLRIRRVDEIEIALEANSLRLRRDGE